MYGRSRTRGFLKTFSREDDGAFTLEMVIWSPLILGAIMLILDFAFLMTVDAGMWNASRDTARALSTHRIRPDEAEEYMRGRMQYLRDDYDIDIDVSRSEVVASVALDATDAALTPVIGRYVVGTLNARVAMMREPE